MAQIILFDSIKGGVGKSTLAAQFTVYLLKKGKKVAIFDGDSQQSIAYWAMRRNHSEKNLEHVIIIDSSKLNEINQIKDQFDFIIADSAGVDSKIGRFLLSISNIVVSPLQPKQSSMDTVAKHNNVLNEALAIRKNKFKSFYVLNMCSTHSWDSKRKDALNFLNAKSKSKQIYSEVIQIPIYHRELLDTTFSNGESVFDKERSTKSKTEISIIIDHILGV